MGFGTSGAKAKPQFTGIQIQTASSTLPVALAGGLTRLAPNLWDYVDFQAHKQKQKAGKGFGGSSVSYTYSATVLLGLCEGPITGIVRAWKDNGELADYASLGFSLFTGAMPQAPWGYMVGAHPTHADGYPGEAYLAKANYDLGTSAALPNHSFEVQALHYNTAAGGALPDADPALWIQDYLTDADHGVGFPASLLDAAALLSSGAATTTGDSAFQTYCRAMGFGISPALVEQEAASAAIDRWCLATNTAAVWTGYSLKLIPYGDETVTGHGVTYLPPTATTFDFADDDFEADGDRDPIRASRSDPADAKNIVKFVIRDRANAYNDVPVTFQDDNAIALQGRKEAGTVTLREICDVAMGGRVVALYGQRVLYGRNAYSFKAGPSADLLEPMDCGYVSDPALGALIPVRIVEIEEDEADDLAIIVEQFDGTLGGPPAALGAGGATPAVTNSLATPGPVNPPIIFEPPSTLAQFLFGSTSACVIAAVSGGDGTTAVPNWGGCFVHVSTDNATYQAIGQIDAPARMGKTTTALAAYGGANPDTVHTVGVSLVMSAGDLAGASAADAAGGATLCYVGGEYLAFEVATLTGTHAYTLSNLYRGLYGSSPGAHLTNLAFARLDGAIFHFDLPPAYRGVPLWFKFQSYNIWGNALEDLAGCTAYTFTPAGTGYGGGALGVPTTPTGLSQVAGVGQVALSWAANPAADNVTEYSLWRAAGTGALFGTAVKVWTGFALSHIDAGLTAATGYTYFLEAANAVGASAATAGLDATTPATSFGSDVTINGNLHVTGTITNDPL